MSENTVTLDRSIYIRDVRAIHARLIELAEFRGFSRIFLDFSKTELAFADSVLPVIALVRRLQSEGVSFGLILPEFVRLRRLFLNANWAHLVDPMNFEKADPDKFGNLSVREFNTPQEQNTAVNLLIDKILRATGFLEREHLRALEWSIQEITDNAMQHSESPTGGLVQLSIHPNAKEIEFIVSDAGIGVPDSLRTAFPHLRRDDQALEEAVKEGVTRGTGQGNGLFGSFQICALSGGPFYLNSGYGFLTLDRTGKSHARLEATRLCGATVACVLNFNKPLLLEKSLKIAQKPFSPVDFIETTYESGEGEYIDFSLSQAAKSIGSRISGYEIRKMLLNMLRFSENKRVRIDASNIGIMSSSFADEAFAKLYIELGEEIYGNSFVYYNISPINEEIINRSIRQRRS